MMLQDPSLLEYVGAPESARLLSPSHGEREDTLGRVAVAE